MGNHLFLIVSDDPNRYTVDFEIDPDHFVRELIKTWPNSSATISHNAEECLVYWNTVNDRGDWLVTDGTLFPQFVSFRWGTTDEETIEFVLWFRRLIPDTEPLLFTFDAYGTYFPIASSASRDDIRKILATWS
jgi:hypothetical protein